MGTFKELAPAIFFNYALGYVGALLVILVMFNIWKNKLDNEHVVEDFKNLAPEFWKWSYLNFDDWLVMIVATPVFVFLQTPATYLVLRYYEYELTDEDLHLYSQTYFLVSFILGVISQSLSIGLLYVGSFLISKVKKLIGKKNVVD